jgi:hypothetical protein
MPDSGVPRFALVILITSFVCCESEFLIFHYSAVGAPSSLAKVVAEHGTAAL